MDRRHLLAGSLAAVLPLPSAAAPDEDQLGKRQGYPVGTARTWYYDESVRVGSFTHQAEIPGIFRGRVHTLQPSARPMPLPKAAREPDYRWSARNEPDLPVDGFLARHRIMGLLIVKDGVVQVERYQYDRGPVDRFTSNSMAKSITALAVGIALGEGAIKSLDDRADAYAPKLKGSVFGETTLRNLLRMASGAKYLQTYDGSGDTGRLASAIVRDGIEGAARLFTERDTEPGTRFHYASVHSVMLAAVLRGATGRSLSEYLTPRLWQAIGAEHTATWYADRTGLEVALGNFNATLRDWGRLGVVLAHDGVRPDEAQRPQVVPRDFLLDATDWQRAPPAFRPGRATPSMGYGYQFWTLPGARRRFAMLGAYGQSVFVDPGLDLVIVQCAANATANAGSTPFVPERLAFWRGVVRHHGAW